MDNILVIRHILNDLQEAVEENADAERRVYERVDPFQLPDERFIKIFRLSKGLAREVIEILEPFIIHPNRRSALTVEQKVLIALNFYGYGCYQEAVGKNLFNAVSQATVSRCLHEVTDALNNEEVMGRFIKFPENIEQLNQQRLRFYAKYQFPGVIGGIDCTHIAIVAPKENEHVYVNRKNYHSLNVQLICGENLQILHVNARFPGSSHDSHIWNQSNVSGVMEEIYRRNPHDNFYLLGDSGYPLRPWLVTPLEVEPQPGTPHERFNSRLKSVRSVVERCNGNLKNRFRCLLKHRVLHYPPETAGKIVNACVVLHNLCISHNVPVPEDLDGNVDFGIYNLNNHNGAPPAVARVNPDLAAARRLQVLIANNHFNN